MITSTSNARVKLVRLLQKNRNERWQRRLFVIEGLRLASEAIKARHSPSLVFHTQELDDRGRKLLHGLAHLGAEVEMVSESVMKACSDTENPAGLLAMLPFPKLTIPEKPDLVLIVDRLADPGNLGAMFRTALAADVKAVFLLEGTVDPFNPKVVRAAMGSHFHLPIEIVGVQDLTKRLGNMELWLAEKGTGIDYRQVDWRKPSGLIVGSEAHGVSRSLRSWTKRRVHIPMKGNVESLNASIAAAIILFEIVRQREAG
jgi:TrmH family RNA methyltransferase